MVLLVATLGGCGDSSSTDGGAAGASGSSSGGSSGAGGSGTGGATGGVGGAAGGSGASSTGGAAGGGGTSGSGGGMAGGGGVAGIGPGCTGAADVVCVEVNHEILFQSATGATLARRAGPDEFDLPSGGMVTVIDTVPTTLFDVPTDATIRFEQPRPPPAQQLQSLNITVPEWMPNTRADIWTGCELVEATYGVAQTLVLDETCVENGMAEVIVSAYDPMNTSQNARLHIPDIAVGDASQPPLTVTIPAWTTTLPTGSFTLDQFPMGLQGSLSTSSWRGARNNQGGLISLQRQMDGSAAAALFTFLANAGTYWTREINIWEEAAATQDDAVTRRVENMGHPLSLTQTATFADLFPIPSAVAVAGRTLSWTGLGGSEADRVFIQIIEDSTNSVLWTIWAPPTVTSVELPTDNPEVAAVAPATIGRVDVNIEGRETVSGYSDALTNWSNRPASSSLSAPEEFRYSRMVERMP